MKTHSLAIVTALALANLVLGCSKKAPECEATVSTLNPSVDALNKAMALPDDKPELELAQAQAVGKAADDGLTAFGKLTPTTPELQKFDSDYKALLTEISTASKTDQDAAKTAADVSKKADSLPDQMKAAMDKMTKACQGDGMDADDLKDCTAVADKLGKMPDDITDEAKVKAYNADLNSIDVKRPATKQGIADLTAGLNGFVKLAQDAKSAQAKMKSASDMMDGALKKQNTSVDTLNKFCTGGS